MPVVTVDWWKGNDRSRRARLVSEVTSTVARVAGCPGEAVTVIVRDVEPAYWGKGGELADTAASGEVEDEGTAAGTPLAGESEHGRELTNR